MRRDKFENGIFWELNKDLERQFQNFLEYVPYLDENKSTISFILLNLILGIGGYVDSAFKEMARYSKFSNNDDCREIVRILEESDQRVKQGKAPKTVSIRLPLKAFDEKYNLFERKVIFRRLPERKYITPFQPYNQKTNAPKWWEIYNELKHDVGVNIKEATLQNTLNALAGAFLLNVIHTPSALRLFSYGVLRIEFMRLPHPTYGGGGTNSMLPTESNIEVVKNWLEKKPPMIPGFVETPLFVYDYREMEMKEKKI